MNWVSAPTASPAAGAGVGNMDTSTVGKRQRLKTDQAAAASVPVAGSDSGKGPGKGKNSRKDLRAVGKVAVEAKHLARLLAASLYWTILLPVPSAQLVVDYTQKAGQDYRKATQGVPGHGKGGPAAYMWGAYVHGVIAFAKQTMQQPLEPSASHTASKLEVAIQTLTAHKDGATTILDIRREVSHCFCRVSRDKKSLVVQYCCTNRPVCDALLVVCEELLKVTPQLEPAPPSKAERRVKKMVGGYSAVLDDDTEDEF
jgi:hypothetical protein